MTILLVCYNKCKVIPCTCSIVYMCGVLSCRLDQPVKRIRTELEHPIRSQSPGVIPASIFEMRASRDRSPSPQQPPHDPYEFSDEASSSAGNFGNKRSMRQSRDDNFPRPSPFGSKQVGKTKLCVHVSMETKHPVRKFPWRPNTLFASFHGDQTLFISFHGDQTLCASFHGDQVHIEVLM